MGRISTLMQRELGAYFLSPIAYVVIAIFLFSSGLAFGLGSFAGGQEASLRLLLQSWMLLILGFVVPLLTMRLLAEELRSGTIETLMTAPVSETDVVLGKFLGVVAFYAIMLATLVVYPVLLSLYGEVDLWLLLCHLIGLLLLGALYASVGIFFSAVTRHQLIAGLLTVAVLAIMTFASQALALQVEGWPRAFLQHISIGTHFGNFVRGIVDLNGVTFFLTTTALFLFLTVKTLETRRWK